MGAEITGVGLRPETAKNLYTCARIDTIVDSRFVDIRDAEALTAVFDSVKPEIVMHLAAQPLVIKSYDDPVETYSTNVMGTLNVLEAGRKAGGVGVVVVITSDKCYENQEWFWRYREADPLGGHDPYSSSKACVELLVSSYRRSFLGNKDATRLLSARAGNVIGGGDWSENRLVPDIIKAIQNNRSLELRNPSAIRPWQHVLEPLSGYIELAERAFFNAEFAQSWNFGPHQDGEKSVEWIARRFMKEFGLDQQAMIEHTQATRHEAGILKLDSSQSIARLNWRPRWTLETAVRSIVEWHQREADDDDMLQVCKEQIQQFSNEETNA